MTYKMAWVIFLTTLFWQAPAANAEIKRKSSSYFKETTIDDRRGADKSISGAASANLRFNENFVRTDR